MKKLLLIFLVLLIQKAQSQIVFCPPGAEWHYSFFNSYAPTIGYANEKIKYVRDSMVGNETVKVLEHRRFLKGHNGYNNFLPTMLPGTIIKQKGDTVFFRNASTQQTWQVLYNYAALAGQAWQNTITLLPVMTPTLPVTNTYTVTVDSVKNVVINSFNLRRLYVRYTGTIYKNSSSLALNTETVCIDERMGCNQFLFNFYNKPWTTGFIDYFDSFLCYGDDAFGTKQISAKSCDYTTLIGIKENNYQNAHIKLYPNPTKDFFTIKGEAELLSSESTLSIRDLFGREIKWVPLNTVSFEPESDDSDASLRIDISDLESGIYILHLSGNGQTLFTGKLVKSP